ncbi:MAG: hypothetical protein N2255_00500 [Kiritimatiellae bacterium]|jgi:hypothetical protein|nr:hypothetical protein [Kiritimatiellia bacterium]
MSFMKKMVPAAILLLATCIPSVKADEKCEIFGEIAVEAVKLRATQVCVLTKHPVACAIAAALESAAGNGLAKMGTTAGCEWLVEKSGTMMKITIRASGKNNVEEARKAEAELRKAKEYKPKK